MRAWKASGLSRAAFAKDEDYSERSLGWWSWKLASEGESIEPKRKRAKTERSKSQPFELVEVVAQQSEFSDRRLTIRVGSLELLVGRGFDRELLLGVLDTLEARS